MFSAVLSRCFDELQDNLDLKVSQVFSMPEQKYTFKKPHESIQTCVHVCVPIAADTSQVVLWCVQVGDMVTDGAGQDRVT